MPSAVVGRFGQCLPSPVALAHCEALLWLIPYATNQPLAVSLVTSKQVLNEKEI